MSESGLAGLNDLRDFGSPTPALPKREGVKTTMSELGFAGLKDLQDYGNWGNPGNRGNCEADFCTQIGWCLFYNTMYKKSQRLLVYIFSVANP